jgi:hypothetical protein
MATRLMSGQVDSPAIVRSSYQPQLSKTIGPRSYVRPRGRSLPLKRRPAGMRLLSNRCIFVVGASTSARNRHCPGLPTAQADEGGTPFWLSGSYFFSAAVPNQPGWYIPTQFYYYNGSAFRNKSFQRGDTLNLGLTARLELAFATPTWVPDTHAFATSLAHGRRE